MSLCLPLPLRVVCIQAWLGREEVPVSDSYRKLETGNQGRTPLHLWLVLKQAQHPHWPLLPPSVAGPTLHQAEGSRKSSIWPASCGRESFRWKWKLWMWPMGSFFGLQQSEFLYIFLCSLNCYPLYSSTQRDGTFGKIILSSTPTCDHNFESRNLLSSYGKNKGPEVI